MPTIPTLPLRRALRRLPRRFALACGLSLGLIAGSANAQVLEGDLDLPQLEVASGQRLFTPLGGIFRAEYRGGDRAAGQQDGFTRLGLFRPDYVGDTFVFVDGALSLTDDGAVGGNLGVGARRMSESFDAFWGVNAWYDHSTALANDVKQVGVGGELVMGNFDVNANAYIPFDDRQIAPGTTLLSPPTFSGNRVLLDTLVPYEIAMTGYDLEAGMITPPIMGMQHIRVAAGYYHYERSGTQTIDGVRGKIESFITPNLSAGITVQNDAVFDTTVTFQVIWRPGANVPEYGAEPLYNDTESRIAQLVKRQYQPTVMRESRQEMQFARHPDGELIFVSHADSAAPGGGDTTFEMPTNDLSLAASSAPERAIVFAHGDSVFDGQDIVLNASQRLLGEGIDHTVPTMQVGNILLPEGNGGGQPMIINANNAAITLADDTEVSNFHIEDAGDAAITANGVDGTVNVNNVSIESGFTGISILNSNGSFTFTDTTINDVFSDSFSIDGGAPDILYTGDISNFQSFSGAIIRLTNTTGGNIEFSGGTLIDFMGDGISIFSANTNLVVENFTSFSGNADGISLLFNQGNYTFRNIEINGPLLSGVDMFLNEEATITLTDIEITTNMARAISASLNGMLVIDGDSRITTTGDAVLDIFETNVDITLQEIEANSPIINALTLFDVDGGITINEGTILNSGLEAVFASNVERLELRNLEITGSGFGGVAVEVVGDMRSDVTLDNLLIENSFDPSSFRFFGSTEGELYLNLTNNEDSLGFQFNRDPGGTIFFAGSLGQGMSFPDTNGNLANNGNTSNGGAPTEIITGTGNEIEIVDPSEVRLPE